ncbi:hypothetical protein EBM76_21925 [Vibrio parahaemolyticus]|nr:hypothetical protein [Vibrio parahaemolyticus]
MPAPLNAALVANEENVAKSECLGLMSVCFWLGFFISISSYLGLRKSCFGFLCGSVFLFQKPIYLLKVSFVILSFSNELFDVVSPFLRRFEFQVVSLTGALKLRLI